MKILMNILFVLLLIATNANGQIDTTTFKYIQNKYITKQAPTFVILCSSKDCFKCSLPLNNIAKLLNNQPENKTLTTVIITDNYAMANKYKQETGLNAAVYFDKELFVASQTHTQSAIVLIENNAYSAHSIQNIQEADIQNLLQRSLVTNYSFSDSLFDFKLFVSTATPFGILLFDEKIQTGITTDLSTQMYHQSIFTDTSRINQLPDRFDKSQFSTLSFQEGNRKMQHQGIEYLHVNSILGVDSTLFITFSINKTFRALDNQDNYAMFTSYFMAKKKLQKESDFLSAFDLNTYNNIYFIDSFSYNHQTYPLGNWMSQQPIGIDEQTIQLNVSWINNGKFQFGGRATIDISDAKTAKMIAIDTEAPEVIFFNNVVNFQGNQYVITKEVIDESISLGKIKIERQQ